MAIPDVHQRGTLKDTLVEDQAGFPQAKATCVPGGK